MLMGVDVDRAVARGVLLRNQHGRWAGRRLSSPSSRRGGRGPAWWQWMLPTGLVLLLVSVFWWNLYGVLTAVIWSAIGVVVAIGIRHKSRALWRERWPRQRSPSGPNAAMTRPAAPTGRGARLRQPSPASTPSDASQEVPRGRAHHKHQNPAPCHHVPHAIAGATCRCFVVAERRIGGVGWTGQLRVL